MEGTGAYGGGKAGGAFDPIAFAQRPPVILRAVCWLFSVVVFGCISSKGWMVDAETGKEVCLYNKDTNACNYGVGISVIAFIASVGFIVGEFMFEQMSSVKTRKHYVLGDLGFSDFVTNGLGFAFRHLQVFKRTDELELTLSKRMFRVCIINKCITESKAIAGEKDKLMGIPKDLSTFWAFLYFVGFCYLTNAWGKSENPPEDKGVNNVQAAIVFSFFAIFTWAGCAFFAFQRFRQGAEAAFAPTYEVEGALGGGGGTGGYSSYPGAPDPDPAYQDPPFSHQRGGGEFQAPTY